MAEFIQILGGPEGMRRPNFNFIQHLLSQSKRGHYFVFDALV